MLLGCAENIDVGRSTALKDCQIALLFVPPSWTVSLTELKALARESWVLRPQEVSGRLVVFLS